MLKWNIYETTNNMTQQPLININLNTEKEVAEAVENLRKLMIYPDQIELEAILGNELHYGHSDGDLEDKATFIKSLLSKKSDFISISLSAQTINLYGATAVVRHILEAATYDDKINRNIKLLILSVWNLQNANWKIVARQAVKIL